MIKRRLPRLPVPLRGLLVLLALLAIGVAAPVPSRAQGVAVLVNDEPISDFDVKQRMRLLTVSSRKKATDQVREEAINQLIDERLMVQEARRLDVKVPEERIKKAIEDIAKRSNMNVQQFRQALGSVGINFNAFSRRIEAQILWPMVVQRRFAGRIQVNEDEIEAALARIEGPKETTRYDYVLQKVTVIVPSGASKAEIDSRRAIASRIQHNFRKCEDTRGQVAGLPDIVVEDLGLRNSAELVPQQKKMLEPVGVNETTSPQRDATGFEIIAVCSKEAVTDDQNVRRETQLNLLNQEYETAAKRHLRNLRLDANIERR